MLSVKINLAPGRGLNLQNWNLRVLLKTKWILSEIILVKMSIQRACFMSSLGNSKLFLGLNFVSLRSTGIYGIQKNTCLSSQGAYSLAWETDINKNSVIMNVLHKTKNLRQVVH